MLAKLYDDERWRAFRVRITKLLAAMPSDDVKAFVLGELKAGCQAPPETHEERNALSTLAHTFAPILGEQGYVAFQEEFLRLAAEAESPEPKQSLLYMLAHGLVQANAEKAIPFLREHAAQGPDRVRQASIAALQQAKAPDWLPLMKKLAADAQEEPLRRALTRRLAVEEGHTRAQEPMSVILERERQEANR